MRLNLWLWSLAWSSLFSETEGFTTVSQSKLASTRVLSKSPSLLQQSTTTTETEISTSKTLPEFFPSLRRSLEVHNFLTPTPIQQSSAERALQNENLLLIAPTGSGKTLAYLLPALENAIQNDNTILIVSPTRELAVQLMKDAITIVTELSSSPQYTPPGMVLTVKGIDYPTSKELNSASVLIGTPSELYQVIKNIPGGQDFVAGNVLSTVILDEVDVLLPPLPKEFRTSLDQVNKSKSSKGGSSRGLYGIANKRSSNNPQQDERRKQEQKRKLNAARRSGMDISSNDNTVMVLTDTDKLLKLIATRRFTTANEIPASPNQILAGSATASRSTLDRLNKSLRDAASEVSSTIDVVWSGDVKPCRPLTPPSSSSSTANEEVSNEETDAPSQTQEQQQPQQQPHTIRAVTVPSQVSHKYVKLNKEDANSPSIIISKLAQVAKQIQLKSALIFICGTFGKTDQKEKDMSKNFKAKGKTSASRRNSELKRKKIAAQKAKEQQQQQPSASSQTLSARKACKLLKGFELEAQPLHVALGLEGSTNNDEEGEVEEEENTAPYLVTFEGSARGLHLEAVDVVFVIGRPSSAASYLHLAGRVGRSAPDANGNIKINPGSVISFCTKGSAKELQKWTKQIGGTELNEFLL